MKMRRQCRLWWPKQLLSNQDSSSSIYWGGFPSCSPSSLDIIVACTCSEGLLSSSSPGIENVAGIQGIPKLHHIHWNGLTVSEYDVHVIIYETPSYGAHHFSLCHSGSNEQMKTSIKNPKWVDELHKKQQFIELDTVIVAINCTAAAKRIFERHVAPKRSLIHLSIFPMYTFKLLMHHLSLSSSSSSDDLHCDFSGFWLS
ncbi:hypothetical protein SESBI_26755 [Sesbania bispinosa]|nr:hypothetical protein SESBI_26755 [Sesbania bispinosa]